MATCFLVIGSPVLAHGSLGITGATFGASSTEDEGGLSRFALSSSVDVRITAYHGIQSDQSLSETATGTLGQLQGHLYLAPNPDRKYGLFLALSDMDGRSMSWVSAGAEGMLSLGHSTIVDGRAGLGVANSGSLDFIFGGVSVSHEISRGFEIQAALDLADFDEASFRATAIDATLQASYSPIGAPWGIYANVTRYGLAGRDGGPAATRIGLGVTISLGNSGGTRPATRMFRNVDPVAPLVRRGLW